MQLKKPAGGQIYTWVLNMHVELMLVIQSGVAEGCKATRGVL